MSNVLLIAFTASLLWQNPPPAEKQPDPTSNSADGYPPSRGLVRPPEANRDKVPFDDLLKGPTVVEPDSKTLTIVHRNFDGTLEDIGPEPDYAAIGLLQLTAEQRRWYDTIHAQRLAVFDQCTRSNYGLILELATLQGETDPQKRVGMIEKVRTAYADYINRGSFYQEVKDHLTPPQREQAQKMIEEHRQARVAEIRRTLGEDATAAQIAQRARADGFGQMIRQSIERFVGLERDSFDRLSTELDLSPEQKSKAEAIFQPLGVKRFQGIDTPEDRAAAFAELNKILTPEQRKKALEVVARNLKPATSDHVDPRPATEPATQPSATSGNMDETPDNHRHATRN